MSGLTDKLANALSAAESFISGFEDDELQEGVGGMLEQIRSALADHAISKIGRAHV